MLVTTGIIIALIIVILVLWARGRYQENYLPRRPSWVPVNSKELSQRLSALDIWGPRYDPSAIPPTENYNWHAYDEDEQMLLRAAPPIAEGTGEHDPLATMLAFKNNETYAAYAAQVIGVPEGNFAEPTEATGRGKRREVIKCNVISRSPGGTLEPMNSLDEAQSWFQGRTTLSGMRGPVRLRRHHPGYSSTLWGIQPQPGIVPAAKTNLLTPDLSILNTIPDKCVYVTRGNARIAEECSDYTMNNPRDDLT